MPSIASTRVGTSDRLVGQESSDEQGHPRKKLNAKHRGIEDYSATGKDVLPDILRCGR